MAIELRNLRQFVAIAELGSYRRASQALFIAQPALSVSIRKLEEAVGTPLLVRGARGVTLTQAGMALLTDARRALFHAEQGRRAARMVALGEGGSLRLGFVGSATYALLPRCVPAFRQRYPDVRLELSESTSVGVIELLRANRIDAGFIRGPVASAPDIDMHEVETDDLMMVVPADHPLAGRDVIALADCRDEIFVAYSVESVPGLHNVMLAACVQAGFTARVGQEATQVQTVVSLVASGLGVAMVPASARLFSHPGVRFLNVSDAGARAALALSLVLPHTAPCAAAIRMRDYLLEPREGVSTIQAEEPQRP